MTLLTVVHRAVSGWLLILRGAPGWESRFSRHPAGLVTALALFAFCALLAVAFASAIAGLPSPAGLLEALLAQSLAVLALLIGLVTTRHAVPSPTPLLALLIPGIYALNAYLLVGTLLSLLGGPVLLALWLALGFMVYRLGRVAAGWSLGVALAFSALTLVLLIGMPSALYMLIGVLAAPA